METAPSDKVTNIFLFSRAGPWPAGRLILACSVEPCLLHLSLLTMVEEQRARPWCWLLAASMIVISTGLTSQLRMRAGGVQ